MNGQRKFVRRVVIGAAASAVLLTPLGALAASPGDSGDSGDSGHRVDAAECSVEQLPLPPGVDEARLSAADPTGSYLIGAGFDPWTTLLWHDGEVTKLPEVLEGAVQDINSSGDIVGFVYRADDYTFDAWRYLDGKSSPLPKPDGFESAFVRAIDSEGNAVGYGSNNGGSSNAPAYWPADDPDTVKVLKQAGNLSYGMGARDISEDGRVLGFGEGDSGLYMGSYVWPDVDSEPQHLRGLDNQAESAPSHISGSWVTGADGNVNDPGGLLWNLDTGKTIVRKKTLNFVNSDGDASFKSPYPAVILRTDGTKSRLPGLDGHRPRFVRAVFERDSELTAAGFAKFDEDTWRPVTWSGC